MSAKLWHLAQRLKYGLSHPLEIPDRTWEHMTLDLITGLPVTSEGHDACVVFVDRQDGALLTVLQNHRRPADG